MTKPFANKSDSSPRLPSPTGSFRTEHPVYVHHLPPCNHACPAGEDIQGWLHWAESGDYQRAWESLVRDNPFPALMGRVCYHTCETVCNRSKMDEAVNIHAVERFLGDEAIRQGWQFKVTASPSGKRVLIVGAGPSGLCAAYHLAVAGHKVTLRDAEGRPGGMMRYGIPQYRLPREVLDAEVERIRAMGVEIQLNARVEDLALEMRDGGFDAAFLATGAHIARRAYIPAADASRILDAVALLRGMEEGEKPQLGRRVVVYGGGNTAIDVARTARRLGATDALIVYRRTRERMPATDSEVQEALEEGVRFRWLSTVKQADEGELMIEKMELDATGFPQPTGEFDRIEGDSLVLALGQDADYKFLENVDGLKFPNGTLEVDEHMMTGHAGIFAGGDMVPSARTVTVAAGHGKKAARNIDGYLRGTVYSMPDKHPMAESEKLNKWYYSDAPKTVQPMLDEVRRISTFGEVVGGLDAENALFEARRCLSCGNCFSCDKCYVVCPETAIQKLPEAEPGWEYEVNYELCTGCRLCAEECPCGAIEMVAETM